MVVPVRRQIFKTECVILFLTTFVRPTKELIESGLPLTALSTNRWFLSS